MKMVFFSSRSSLVVSDEFFSEKHQCAESTVDTQMFPQTLFEFYHQSQNMTTSVDIYVHPCEKVIGMFFHNQIWSRLSDMIRLCLVCIKRSIEEVTKCQISKRGYYQGRSDEIFKKARCQICDVKFGHRIVEAVVFFDQKMHNFIQITFNFTNMWSKDVISWFSDIILHE